MTGTTSPAIGIAATTRAALRAAVARASLHETAFARALHSLDLAAPVIDKNRYGVEPFSLSATGQRVAIHRLRAIDGSIVLRQGIDALVLVQAVLIGGRSVVEAHGLPPGAR